ncbi:hypothetical protein [Micromonospora chersina]|uniref:hypothetical protein n=1 Tax=Micromonospora chersina TaxID=47854 RepID=UPI0033A6EBEB
MLVISSGDGTGINFVRSLRRAGAYRTIGVDIDFDNHLTSEADVRYFVPVIEKLIDTVNKVSTTESVELVYAADTDEALDVVSRQRERLSTPTFLPDLNDHLLVEDKWRTHQRLQEAGLAVPHTTLVRCEQDLADALARHERVWLRRVTGSGGAGSLATDSLALGTAWVDAARGWGEFTAAEQLTRRTATFSGVWWDGELIASQLRERTSWKYAHLSPSGVTGITSGQRTLWDEELHELAVASIRATVARPHGAIGVDFTYHQDGRALVTEVQPARFYSSMEFLAAVGINLPDVYCRLALGRPLPPGPLLNPVRTEQYWFKAVDKLPMLMSAEKVHRIARVG